MVASVGKEDVQFAAPLKLLNKVESYLQDVIDSMQTALKTEAIRSVKSVLSKPRGDWLYEDLRRSPSWSTRCSGPTPSTWLSMNYWQAAAPVAAH